MNYFPLAMYFRSMRIWKSLAALSLLLIWSCQSEPQTEENNTKTKQDSLQSNLPKAKVNPKLDSLNAVLEGDPNNLTALVARGSFMLRNGNQQNAWLDFQRAFAIDSMNPDLLLNLGELYMIRNQSRQARNMWTNCAMADPEAIECRLNLVKIHASIKNFEPALRYANELIEIDEFFAPAYLYKGIIIRDSRQDTNLALSYFQKATELDQDYVEALDLTGVTLAQRGDTLAQYYYKRILELQPNNAEVYYKLGVHYMNIDELNRAIEAYTKATQINPQHSDAFYNLGYIFTVIVKDYREAKEYYSKSIAADPEHNYKAYYGRGYAYEMLGDVINAEKDYRKTIELLPVHRPAKEGLDRIRK